MKGGLRSRILPEGQSKGLLRSNRGIFSDTTGFTLIEVLIVLAVTGGLFISAVVMISGRTNKTQFEQSINQVTAQLRQNINEVSSGYYPNTGFRCTPNGGTVTLSAGTTAQGTNSGCILLGRVLQFGIQNTDPEQIVSFPIAGRQFNNAGDQVQSLNEAGPKAVSPSTTNPNTPNSTTRQPLQYGLKVSKMYYNSEANKIGAVGFISTLAQYEGTKIVSGSQRLSMIPVIGTDLNRSQASVAEAINTNLVSSPVSPANGVYICFDSGTTNQSGLVQIGGGNRQLSVTLTIKGNKGC